MTGPRYLEDLTVGETRTSPTYFVSEEEALEFARRFDPQAMHIDPEAAARGPFKGLIASGWHTAALAMRVMADVAIFGATEALGLGVEKMTWPTPVRPGDTLQGEVRIGDIRVSQSKPTHGVVRLDVTLRNQHGAVVLTLHPSCWVPRRPAFSGMASESV